MCRPEKCTARRGRSVVPETRLRILLCRTLTGSIVAILLSQIQVTDLVLPYIVIGRSFLPSAGPAHPHIGSPYPYKAPADNRTEYRLQPGRRLACRFLQSKSSCFPGP